MVYELGKDNSLIHQFIAEIRDAVIQKDKMRFRRNLERIGEISAYEISKTMNWYDKEIVTPLGIAVVPCLREQPIIATILRAGLPLHQGLLNYFDNAESAFVSAYRKHHKDGSFDVKVEYLSSPVLENKVLILCDPMLATGTSMVLSYKAMIELGSPVHTHILTAVGCKQGINYIKRNLPSNISIWAGAIDEELTAQAYIVPGLGDAGDLAFGQKN
jgi:uracil phosphoribosyltransferase